MLRGMFSTSGHADSYCDRFDWGREEQEMSIATHQPMGHDTAITVLLADVISDVIIFLIWTAAIAALQMTAIHLCHTHN